MSIELETVAHHEAGHTVAAWLLRIGFHYVTITPNPEGDSLGHVLRSPLPRWFNPEISSDDPENASGEAHRVELCGPDCRRPIPW